MNGTLTIQNARAIYHVSRKGREFVHSLFEVDFPGTTLLARIFYDGMPAAEIDVLEDDTALF